MFEEYKPLITLIAQCGPIRYRDDALKQAEKRPFEHYIVPRFTSFRVPLDTAEKEITIQEMYSEIVVNVFCYEKLYDSSDPVIDRVGLQGDAMTVAVCADNEKIDEDIKLFNNALSNDDELIGERLRTLSRILKDMGY